jgi:hypothetical protein
MGRLPQSRPDKLSILSSLDQSEPSAEIGKMPSKKPGKITFKGRIDPCLIPTHTAPGYEIVDAKVTNLTVEVRLSDGRLIIPPLSRYSTLQPAISKQRRPFEDLVVGLM